MRRQRTWLWSCLVWGTYVASFFVPAAFIGPVDVQEYFEAGNLVPPSHWTDVYQAIYAWEAICYGRAGLGTFASVANLLFLIGWVAVWTNRRRTALVCGFASTLVAASESPIFTDRLGPGYFMWLGCMFGLLVASIKCTSRPAHGADSSSDGTV